MYSSRKGALMNPFFIRLSWVKIKRLGFSLLPFIFLYSCSYTQPPVPKTLPAPIPSQVFGSEYTLNTGDILWINVWRHPDLSVTVPVRPDGNISVPLVQDVSVGGRTASHVANIIQKELEKYIKDPHVTAIITKFSSTEYLTRIRITGAVKQPISVNYSEGITVLDFVLDAGGLNDFAAPNKAYLYRPKLEKRYPIHLDSIMKNTDLTTNYKLFPGDVIHVPIRWF